MDSHGILIDFAEFVVAFWIRADYAWNLVGFCWIVVDSDGFFVDCVGFTRFL